MTPAIAPLAPTSGTVVSGLAHTNPAVAATPEAA